MTTAQNIAEELGRDWTDCGAYERMSFEDEARRRNEAVEPNRMRYVRCETCGGTGEVEVRPIVGAYEDPTPHHAICAACEGYGMECVETDPVTLDDLD
jgi:DnaJ-class molecular chaperone